MFEWLGWFTDHANSKVFALLWFFTAFVVILLYVYTGKRRKQRLESYKYIPFQEGDEKHGAHDKESRDEQRKD